MRPAHFTLAALLLAAAGPALADPVRYDLQADRSQVGFETDFGSDKITGSMPVRDAQLQLDFRNVGASKIDVALDVADATASFPFAAQALKGPKVLDARQFPQITFRSTSVRASGPGAAEISGLMTIRGVTKPEVLQAQLYRQQGTDSGDLSQLAIHLTGAVNRSEFGATGWSDAVGDQVRLNIVARVAEAK